MSILTVVFFPAPLGPKQTNSSPWRTPREMSSTPRSYGLVFQKLVRVVNTLLNAWASIANGSNPSSRENRVEKRALEKSSGKRSGKCSDAGYISPVQEGL